MPVTPFEVRLNWLADDVLTIKAFGDLDLYTATLFDAALTQVLADVSAEPGMYVQVDLAGLSFCDSAGLDCLNAAVAALETAGAQLGVLGARGHVGWLLSFAAERGWLTSRLLATAVEITR